ncbi:MAG: GNAT family N-acetyltransferase [Spirochaetes bacterium]|nr:GNAT family N-acetyltransferase [Spirochaetota bacterium]
MTAFKLIKVLKKQKQILKQLIELYLYDFSEFDNKDVDESGHYGYKYLDHYWKEKNKHPFFIKVKNKFAGFVLLSNHCHILKNEQAKSISEFFIMKKYRRKGIGKKAAIKMFDMFRGDWEIRQHPHNIAAQKFWKNVITIYTGNNFSEKELISKKWSGKVFIFNNEQK